MTDFRRLSWSVLILISCALVWVELAQPLKGASPSVPPAPAPGSDAVLTYSRFVGISPGDYVAAVAVDSSGNAYVTGKNSAGLVFVTKVSSDGKTMVYNTVLGSGYTGAGNAIAVDATGRAIITGSASAGFPTTAGAFQATAGAGAHAFVALLDPTGATVVYASYLAGSVADQGNGVAFDASGNVYVAGATQSPDFPTTAGAFQTAFGSSTQSGFVAKLNPAASGAASLVYSTFVGGPATPAGENAIAVDATGNAYVVGQAGNGFPTTSGAFAYTGSQSSSGGAFVTKLNPAGASLVYSAYLGLGDGTGIALDGSGNAYVTGIPEVSDFPTTAGAYQTTFPSGFVTELNAAGTTLVYSTFLSGPGENATPQSIALLPGCASSCAAFVSGFTIASDFPTINPIQSFNAGGNDGFIVQLSGDGSSAVYSTYLGGSSDEANLGGAAQMPGIAVDAAGNVYVAGETASVDFPVTLSAIAPTQGFLVKIAPTNASEVVTVPASLSFGSQVVGVKSSSLALTLRNMGSKTLNITSVAAAGDFAQTNTCGTSVAGGGSCVLTTAFTPTAAGSRTGTLTITDDAQNGPSNVINLSGTGTDGAVLNFAPSVLTFGNQNVGTTGAAQTVALSNIGDQPLTLSGVTASGDFLETNTCPATLASGANCTLSVSFKPTQPGFRTGNISASSNSAAGGAQTVSMAGTGTGVGTSTLTLSTHGLLFPNQALGTTSAAQSIIVTNSGTVPVTISSVAASGDFGVTNGCLASLAPANSCVVKVTFAPTAIGVRPGSVTITDSTSTSPEVVTLSGAGVNSAPAITLSPAGIAFLDQAVGLASGGQSVTVINSGNAPVSIDRVLTSGDFQLVSNNCPASLAPAAQCNLIITFTPTSVGLRSGTVSVVDSAPGSPQTASLSGNGLVLAQAIVVSSGSLVFPDQVVGATSNFQTLTIYSTGDAPVTISSITASGDFLFQPFPCGSYPSILGPTQFCNIFITFSPTAVGPRTGTLTITDNASGSPQTVALSGNGLAAVASVNVTPVSLDFPDTGVGATSNSQQVSIMNSGNTPVLISSAVASGDYSVIPGTSFGCSSFPILIPPGNNCTMAVDFTPTATGSRPGTLTITDNATGSPQIVNLAGNGVVAVQAIAITPPNMDFGPLAVSTTSSSQIAFIRNVGNEPVVISNIVASPTYTIISTNCLTNLSPNRECQVQVTVTPTATGPDNGTVTFTDSATGSPQTMTLTAQGTSATPSVSILPATGIFDAQTVGTTGFEFVNLRNNGAASLTVSSVVASGDFALSFNGCTFTLSPGAACSYGVTFTPTVGGNRTGSITITDSDPSSPQVQSLAGYGIVLTSGLLVSPTGLSFQSQPVGSLSNSQFVTLTNTGNTNVTISSVVASGDFTQSNICFGTVFANSSCTINVTFNPSTTGTRTGALTITDSAAGSPQTVALSGQGVSPTQTVVVNPPALVFPDQAVSSTGQQQFITITNTGNTFVTISSISTGGDFAVGSGFCGSLPPNGSCNFGVTFTPIAVGTRTGTVTITDNASGSPQTVSFSGKGVAASQSLVISPTALTFSNQGIGSSASQTVVVTNTGNSPVFVNSVLLASADFSLTSNNCNNTLVQPQGRFGNDFCRFVVTFNPSVAGSRTGSVTITDNAPGSPQTVTLTGNGVAPVQSLVISPSTLNFSAQVVGDECVSFFCPDKQSVTLTNTGNTPITLSSTSASGDFLQFSSCVGTIAPGTSCVLPIGFRPSAAGARTGIFTVVDSAPGSPHTIALNGTGITSDQLVSLSQTSVSFGNQTVGLASPPLSVYYSVRGNSSLDFVSISSITASGDFSETNSCDAGLPGGASCSILITFTPMASGTRSGSLVITDNTTASPRTVSLSGTGTLPAFSASPATLTFASQPLGVASAAQTVTVTNTGLGTLMISSVAASGDFGETNTCSAALAPGASCTVSVTFTPSAAGARTGAVTFTDNASGSPQAVTLSGTGSAAVASLSATSLVFGSQNLNIASTAQTVTLTNTGTASLTVTALALAGNNPGEFAKSADTCSGATLAASASCSVTITFTPTAAGSRSAALTFTDNAAGSPQTVTLSGTGVDFAVAPAPSSSATATVAAGQPAIFTLAFTGTSGLAGTVSLSCTGAPTASTCMPVPATFTLNGTTTVNSTVTVTTTARGVLVPRNWQSPITSPALRLFVWLALALLLAVIGTWLGVGRRPTSRRVSPRWAFMMMFLLVAMLGAASMPSCGGSQSIPAGGSGGATGTPAGTYTLDVVATFNSGTTVATHDIKLMLTVN